MRATSSAVISLSVIQNSTLPSRPSRWPIRNATALPVAVSTTHRKLSRLPGGVTGTNRPTLLDVGISARRLGNAPVSSSPPAADAVPITSTTATEALRPSTCSPPRAALEPCVTSAPALPDLTAKPEHMHSVETRPQRAPRVCDQRRDPLFRSLPGGANRLRETGPIRRTVALCHVHRVSGSRTGRSANSTAASRDAGHRGVRRRALTRRWWASQCESSVNPRPPGFGEGSSPLRRTSPTRQTRFAPPPYSQPLSIRSRSSRL